MNNKLKIIIIGGGFGGTYTAKYLSSLAKTGLADITLINRDNYFNKIYKIRIGTLTYIENNNENKKFIKYLYNSKKGNI